MTGNDRSEMDSIVSDWYARNPDVRRLWVYEVAGKDSGNARGIHVIVALAPVCDSDDISPIWLARCAGWQRQLQGRIGRRVHLDWFDGESEAEPCEPEPELTRVCLANIAWRDYPHE